MVAVINGLAVRAWYAWAPGMDTQRQWLEWAGAGSAATGPCDIVQPTGLPMLLRRRATPLGQKIVMAALTLGETARTSRYILASRHGEFSRQLGILDALASAELPSPAEFTMSVHHALAGLLSIHTGNTQGHTAIAAGANTFGMALVEAVACLQEAPGAPVLLLYGDELLPPPYNIYDDAYIAEPLVAAFARAAGIVICPGVGFDVIPTDCIAAALKAALSDATHLALGFDSRSGFSPGTAKTMVWCRM